jgi:hypothetical protein
MAGLVALLVGLAPCVRAADLSGTWKGAFDFQGSSVPLTLHLTVAGNAVTGTVEGLETSPAEIHDGKLDGTTVSFWLNTVYQGDMYKLVYRGTVSAAGDEIAFTFGTEDGSWGTQLTAKRSVDAVATPAVPDVNGNWKGAFEFNGNSVPVAFHLKSAGRVVTGTVDGMAAGSIEIHEGKIDGDTVTFWLNTVYQGDTYKLVYKGKVAADQIAFSFGTEDGSWSAEVKAGKSI